MRKRELKIERNSQIWKKSERAGGKREAERDRREETDTYKEKKKEKERGGRKKLLS